MFNRQELSLNSLMELSNISQRNGAAAIGRRMLNKVPEVTLYFWIIKIFCTTVGETVADFLNINLNVGLIGTSIVMGALLLIAMIVQFRTKKYVPGIYWLTVALVSVFGTLITDILTDSLGVPLQISTVIFTVLLALAFLAWYVSEKTLSMHSIFTTRREAFYWLAILLTFALGTATGDLVAEGLGLGYFVTGLIVASLIALVTIAWRLGLHGILAFWLIYIFTRPLGASIGDYLSQPPAHGGVGLGATTTSIIFLAGILAIVMYLSVTKRDVSTHTSDQSGVEPEEKGGLWQTVITLLLLLTVAGVGYSVRQSALQAPAPEMTSAEVIKQQASAFGDLLIFRTIAQDTLKLLNANKQSEATLRIGDLEYEWDKAQATLKPKDKTRWTEIDGKIDTVLRELRAVGPNLTSEKSALEALLSVLSNP